MDTKISARKYSRKILVGNAGNNVLPVLHVQGAYAAKDFPVESVVGRPSHRRINALRSPTSCRRCVPSRGSGFMWESGAGSPVWFAASASAVACPACFVFKLAGRSVLVIQRWSCGRVWQMSERVSLVCLVVAGM